MRLRANLSGVDKCFVRRERATEVKKPEKIGKDLNKWTRAGKAPKC